jgi:hypothetical protein
MPEYQQADTQQVAAWLTWGLHYHSCLFPETNAIELLLFGTQFNNQL